MVLDFTSFQPISTPKCLAFRGAPDQKKPNITGRKVLLLAQQAKVARKSSQKPEGSMADFVEMIKKAGGVALMVCQLG